MIRPVRIRESGALASSAIKHMSYLLEKFHSLDRRGKWDATTAEIIDKRLEEETGAEASDYVFLTSDEGRILNILTDYFAYQPEAERHIRIAETIDRELSNNKKGIRLGSLPWRRDLYKKGLAELDISYHKMKGAGLLDDSPENVRDFLETMLKNTKENFLKKFLADVSRSAIAICYSHPALWDKIGFPGPAYPEGYAFLGCGEKDKWEPSYL